MSDDHNYDYVNEAVYHRCRGNRLENEIFELREEQKELAEYIQSLRELIKEMNDACVKSAIQIAELKEVLSYYEARQYDDQISNM